MTEMTSLCADETRLMEVELVFAEPDWVWHKTVWLPMGSTVEQAYIQSGFANAFPEKAKQVAAMGIFGQHCREDHILAYGDRLELYRPLQFDPKVSRRRRAMHKQRVKNEHGSV